MSRIVLPEKSPLFFNDGFVFDRQRVVFASQFAEFSGSAVSRVSQILDYLDDTAEWDYYDVQDAILSVTGTGRGDSSLAYFLGINGTVVTMGDDVEEQTISDTERYGRLLRIRAIGDTVFACGMSGQLLSNAGGAWRAIDAGLLGTEGLDFEDIAGTSETDVYAVGIGGIVYHFDGRVWRQLDSPTNVSLSNVRCVSRDDVYVCGNAGTLLRGNARDGWDVLTESGIDQNFWGLEPYAGAIYVAYAGGILLHDGTDFRQVDLGLAGAADCHRLHSNDGILWSIGIDDLAYFDGDAWHRVICPMNV